MNLRVDAVNTVHPSGTKTETNFFLIESRHIYHPFRAFEFIINVQMVERVRKWENVQSYKEIIERLICRDYTMKMRTKSQAVIVIETH